MHLTFRRAVWALIAAVGISVVYMVVSEWDTERDATPIAAQPDKPAPPPPLPAQQPAPPQQVATETLAAKVERLTAEGRSNPSAAFIAYNEVRKCVWSEGTPYAQPECATLPPYQRNARLANLKIAVDAGVPGASRAFLAEGPFGDRDNALKSRPDDPLVVEWKAAVVGYLTRDARKGDVTAMSSLSYLYAEDRLKDYDIAKPNKLDAFAWEYAMWSAQALARPDRDYSRMRDESIARMSRGMTPAEIAAAKAKGAELVAQCCSSSAVPPSGKQGATK